MAGYFPGDVSRPPYPHFEDDPRAEMEEERAAYADWRRHRDRAADDQDECEIDARGEALRARGMWR